MKSLSEKILLSLLGGVAFGCSVTSKNQWYVIKTTAALWQDSDVKNIASGIRDLNRTKLIKRMKDKNGICTIELTNKGKLKALNYYFRNIKIKKEKWDGKWRILIFDVPERLRKGRNALRWEIKKLGFYELQKSVFVIPYECKEDIDFVVNFFELEKYVNYGVLESIDKDKQLREYFELN